MDNYEIDAVEEIRNDFKMGRGLAIPEQVLSVVGTSIYDCQDYLQTVIFE